MKAAGKLSECAILSFVPPINARSDHLPEKIYFQIRKNCDAVKACELKQ